MLFLLILTFWVGTIGEEIETHVLAIESVETYSLEDYLYWNEDIYSHVNGLECMCSECKNDCFEVLNEDDFDEQSGENSEGDEEDLD